MSDLRVRLTRRRMFKALVGDASMVGMARYIAVAPHDTSTNLREQDFEY